MNIISCGGRIVGMLVWNYLTEVCAFGVMVSCHLLLLRGLVCFVLLWDDGLGSFGCGIIKSKRDTSVWSHVQFVINRRWLIMAGWVSNIMSETDYSLDKNRSKNNANKFPNNTATTTEIEIHAPAVARS